MGRNPVGSHFKAPLHHRTDGCGLRTEQHCKSLTLPMHRGTPYLRLCTFRTSSPSTKSMVGTRIFGFPPARETCKLTTWQDAGTRRQAFYTDLPPGQYRFRVIASNNDGVWNEEGATLAFSIAPAWYQTKIFQFGCILFAMLLVWTIHRVRVRQVAQAIGARFDERLAERTRIARDLHDTLLQTIQGSKLVADDALETSSDPDRMRKALEQLSAWLQQAGQEVRAALNSLRVSATSNN